MLAAPSLWIDQGTHRLREGRRLHGPLAVVHMPSVEQLDDLTAVRIVGFDGVNPLDRIATAEREEWITAPSGPLFKAAKQSVGFKVSVLEARPSFIGDISDIPFRRFLGTFEHLEPSYSPPP
jgi:hypothetical protein